MTQAEVRARPSLRASVRAATQNDGAGLVLETAVAVVGVRRLLRRGRSTSAVTLACAWAFGAVPRLVSGTARLQVPPGVGLACGAARVWPALRVPIAVALASWTMIWRRLRPTPVRTWGATLVVVGGAALGCAAGERISAALRARAGAEKRPEVAVVVNCHSGGARLARRAMRALRREGVTVLSEERTTGAGLDAALQRAIEALPPDGRLVVAGGDGTIGRASEKAAGADRALAILPTGTGNDVARSLGISLHPEQAAAVAAWGPVRTMDLGQTDAGNFAHAMTLGMSELFARDVRDVQGWRRPFEYPLKALGSWHRREQLEVSVDIDGTALAMPVAPFEVAVVNAPRLGGRVGVNLPGATVADGYLHVIAVYRGALRRSIVKLVHFVRSGPLTPPVGAVIGEGRRVEIASPREHPYALDGEPAGSTPVVAQVLPAALLVVVPPPGADEP